MAENPGQPDENLIFYLHHLSGLLEVAGRLEESIAAHKESYELIN